VPTFERTVAICKPDLLHSLSLGGFEWGFPNAIITGVRAKLSSGTGTFNFSVANTTASLFDSLPFDEKSELVWHFRANDLGTPAGASDGDAVDIWYSYRKDMAIFRQTTAGERPLYKTALGPHDSHETVLFDGTDDRLDKYSGTTTFAGDWTAFIVIGDLSTTNPAPLLGEDDSSDANVSLYGRDSRMQIRDTDGNLKQYTSALPSDDEIRCIQWNDTTARVSEYVDGDANYEGSAGPTGTFEWDQIGAMTNSAKSIFLDGGISEILVFNSVLNEDSRQLVEGYLGHKWGIAGNLTDTDGVAAHPHASASPIVESHALSSDLVLASTYPSVTGTGISVKTAETIDFYLTECQVPGILTIEFTYEVFEDTSAVSDSVVVGIGSSIEESIVADDVRYKPKTAVFSFSPE